MQTFIGTCSTDKICSSKLLLELVEVIKDARANFFLELIALTKDARVNFYWNL
jgi:hypothetical protein